VGRRRVELDLCRQVRAGVLLLVRRQRGELAVAEVELGVGVVDALADPFGVVGAGEDALRLLAHDDGRAGVLAHRQDTAGRDVDVLQQVQRDEAVVAGRLGVVDDLAQLRQVRWPQVMADVVHRLRRQVLDDGRIDLEECLDSAVRLGHLDGGDSLGRDQPVGRVVRADRKQVGVAKFSVSHGPMTISANGPS
jgi:hypothetical protein